MPKDLDLPPHQWRSERPKPKEPIFNEGWPIAVAVFVTLFVAVYFGINPETGKLYWWAMPLGGVIGLILHQILEATQR